MAFELPEAVCIWLIKSWSGLVPVPTTSPVTSRSSMRFGFLAGLGADEAVVVCAGLGASAERSRKMPSEAHTSMASTDAVAHITTARVP